MANHKSSLKRIRSNNSKRLANRYYAKTMRNALRDIKMITAKAEAEQLKETLEEAGATVEVK